MALHTSTLKFLRYLGRCYFVSNGWIWRKVSADHLPWRIANAHGTHVHYLSRLYSTRTQSLGTYFFRNRPALDLLIGLLKKYDRGSHVDLTVLGCGKGAEVYSVAYAIQRAHIDLTVRILALDIDKDVLEFAAAGAYPLQSSRSLTSSPAELATDAPNNFADQPSSIFERMSAREMASLFDRQHHRLTIKPQFRVGITWHLGDASDPALVDWIGRQDLVIANQFLCHMDPEKAETSLRAIARLAKPGGFLFVSGVDLDVRSKVALDLRWKPVTELICEIHDGDSLLRRAWPLEYWGLEPPNRRRKDWQIRYASVFQLP